MRKGRTRGLWRHLCKSCGRTFNAVTGMPLQGLHKKERWLSFGESLAEGETVGAPARRCGNRGRAPPGRGEGCRAGRRRGGLLPALRPVARIVPHRSEPIRRTANPGSLPHPDGRQPTKPLQGIPVPLPRRRDEIPRKLPSMVPTRLPRRKRKPVNLPRSRRQFGMHTNRKMSLKFIASHDLYNCVVKTTTCEVRMAVDAAVR